MAERPTFSPFWHRVRAMKPRLRPHVQRFSLDEATRAYELLRAGQIVGRAVVVQ